MEEFKPFWGDQSEVKTYISEDRGNVKITYESLGEGTDKVVVLANGLGGRFYTWEPLVKKLWPEYRILTWDYRGLFESGSPDQNRHLSIPNHAEDLAQILRIEKISKVMIVGWSMGVQVAIEFATLYPEKVEKLVLLNGTYGHTLSTAFQPFIRIPNMDRIFHEAIDYVKDHPELTKLASKALTSRFVMPMTIIVPALISKNPKIKYALYQYIQDVCGADLINYIQLFQELDAHSTYHRLKEIYQPTLLISGGLDFLTPAYQSKEMLKKLPNAQAMHFKFGTHFTILEHPKKVPNRIYEFFKEA
ncbi:alpha/beta hydrolase [Deltaproteobacteria bacterium TL4]